MKAHLIIIALLFSAFAAFAGEPPAAAKNALDTLMKATVEDDFERFQSLGDEGFKKRLTKDAFASVVTLLQPLLKDGHEAEFLTELSQQGHKVYLWKITPKVGKDQFVAKLVLSGEQVAGFWIQ